MTDPYLAAQFLQHFLEPGGIPTALESYHHLLTAKLLVKPPHLLRLPVVQLQPLNLSVFSCQITDRLCARMKVDSDIYCHWRLLLLTQIVSNTVSLTTHGRRRRFIPSSSSERNQDSTYAKCSRDNQLFSLSFYSARYSSRCCN